MYVLFSICWIFIYAMSLLNKSVWTMVSDNSRTTSDILQDAGLHEQTHQCMLCDWELIISVFQVLGAIADRTIMRVDYLCLSGACTSGGSCSSYWSAGLSQCPVPHRSEHGRRLHLVMLRSPHLLIVVWWFCWCYCYTTDSDRFFDMCQTNI